jgi:hypothetical protein
MKLNLKVILLFLIFGLTTINIKAQNKKGKSDDLGRIVLNSYVSPQVEVLPSSAKKMLNNKLSQIASKNGMGGSSLNPRFIITPNITVLTKDLTATAPPMTALTLEVTFYIGDGVDGKLFTTTSLEVKGVGTNETKAYISALKQIKPGHPDLKNLIEEGKTEIIKFYNSHCDFIIKEAQTLESQSEFEAAILKLTSVPNVCKSCYDKCMDAVTPIYQKQIDKECAMKLAEAKNVWSTGQSLETANKATSYLSGIDPNSKCFSEAQIFTEEIGSRMKELDQRDWEFELKKQQNEVDAKQAAIKAVRDIGVAYGNSQPQTVTYNTRSWW